MPGSAIITLRRTGETGLPGAPPRQTPCDPTRVVVRRIGETGLPGTPAQASRWDEYVRNHENGTLFHTWAWREAVIEAFHHEAIYLAAFESDRQAGLQTGFVGFTGRIVGVLPLFYINSGFGGRMLVSVPYGVGGGIIADQPRRAAGSACDDGIAAALFEEAKRIAAERKCVTIDLRSERAGVANLPVVERYSGFRKTLPDRPEDVLGWLPRKARAAARNARNKYHLEIEVGDEHLREVWRLYTISMRRLGSLAYPYRFFERLLAHTPGAHWVSLVRWRGKTGLPGGRAVAGLVTFSFRDTVIPYFIGTTSQAKACSAANLIYLAAMERGVAEGFRVFDFGRSRRDNAGSFNFKRFNGFAPRPLEYQIYVAPGAMQANLTPSNPKFQLARALWRHLPMSVTRVVGGRLARHIPG